MGIHHDLDIPLARACRAVGGQSALARLIGKDQSTVHERLIYRVYDKANVDRLKREMGVEPVVVPFPAAKRVA